MKALKSIFSFILCSLIVFSMMLCFPVKASAQESSSPRHVVIFRIDGLNPPWYIYPNTADIIYDGFYGSYNNKELGIKGDKMFTIENLKKWLKPFLDDGNVFGIDVYLGFGNPYMYSYTDFYDSWDKFLASRVWTSQSEDSSLLSHIKANALSSENYLSSIKSYGSIQEANDVVTIVDIGDFHPATYIYPSELDNSDPFFTQPSAEPYRFSAEYLKQIAEDYIGIRSLDDSWQDYYQGLLGIEHRSWSMMTKTKGILHEYEGINHVSVHVNDGLDEYRSEWDYFNRALGQQYMKDVQNAGYFEIQYENVVNFLDWLLPTIRSAHSSAELRKILGNDSLVDVDIIPTLPVELTTELKGKEIEIKFDIQDTAKDEITYDLMKTAALECAVTYKSDAEVISLLKQLGWQDIEQFDGSSSSIAVDHCKYWLAHQTRDDGVEVVSILLCGTDGNVEWVSNIVNSWNPFQDTKHAGFHNAAAGAMLKLTDYMNRHGLSHVDSEYYIRGHSRGAAVGNILSKNLSDIHGSDKVKSILLGTPNVYWDKTGDEADYNNIINIEDGGDVVTILPPGGSKYGQVAGYSPDARIAYSYYQADPGITDAGIFWTHTSENYLARIMTAEPQNTWNSDKWQVIFVHCLTDIEVFNSEGEVVASIEDNIVNPNNLYLITTNEAGQKTIILPSDEEFEIQVTGRADNNAMIYSAYLLSEGGLTEEVEPSVIIFDEGETFTAHLDIDSPATMLKKDFSLTRTIKSIITDHLDISLFIFSTLVIIAMLIRLIVFINKKFE